MPEYLLVNDIHLSDQTPSSCTDTYLDDLLDMLRAIGDLATQRDARAVIWAGDVFHHKTPGRTSHRTIMRVIEIVRAYPCPVKVVPGNHDMLHDRIQSIDETQPLGVLLASGAVTLLLGWHPPTVDLDFDGFLDPVFGVPWLQEFTDETVTRALEEYRSGVNDQAHALVVTHAPLYPPGKELPYENYPAQKWAAAMNHKGTVHYGHVHEPHGIYTAAGVTFSNPGAISRGSLTETNATRKVRVAAWDSDTGQTRHLDIPHKPAADVFRLVEAAQIKSAAADLSAFLGAIGETRLEVASIEAVMAHVRTLDLGTDLETIIENLLIEGAGR